MLAPAAKAADGTSSAADAWRPSEHDAAHEHCSVWCCARDTNEDRSCGAQHSGKFLAGVCRQSAATTWLHSQSTGVELLPSLPILTPPAHSFRTLHEHKPTNMSGTGEKTYVEQATDAVKSAAGYVQETVRSFACPLRAVVGLAEPPQRQFCASEATAAAIPC